jgi:hypothetical protein
VNWTDYLEHVRSADPSEFVQRVIERAGDRTVWFVWRPQLNNVNDQCRAIAAAFDGARTPDIRVFPSEKIEEGRALTEYGP